MEKNENRNVKGTLFPGPWQIATRVSGEWMGSVCKGMWVCLFMVKDRTRGQRWCEEKGPGGHRQPHLLGAMITTFHVLSHLTYNCPVAVMIFLVFQEVKLPSLSQGTPSPSVLNQTLKHHSCSLSLSLLFSPCAEFSYWLQTFQMRFSLLKY